MIFSRALLASGLVLLASAQTPTITSLTGAQETKVLKDLESYFASLMTQPAYTSNAAVLATAIPSSDLEQIAADPTDFLSQFASSTPAWYSNLPSSVQSYYKSIGSAEASIINQDVKGPAPTVGPKGKVVVAAVGMVAGVVAVAL